VGKRIELQGAIHSAYLMSWCESDKKRNRKLNLGAEKPQPCCKGFVLTWYNTRCKREEEEKRKTGP
jgi:hypothetical protein